MKFSVLNDDQLARDINTTKYAVKFIEVFMVQ